jgi:hypothetical protein
MEIAKIISYVVIMGNQILLHRIINCKYGNYREVKDDGWKGEICREDHRLQRSKENKMWQQGL